MRIWGSLTALTIVCGLATSTNAGSGGQVDALTSRSQPLMARARSHRPESDISQSRRPSLRRPASNPKAPLHRSPALHSSSGRKVSSHGHSTGRKPAAAALAPAQAPSAPVPAKPVVSPAQTASLFSIPALYASMMASGGKCQFQLDNRPGGYPDGAGGRAAHYCGDSPSNPNIVYWMSNMDVDCDGGPMTGPCANDPSHSDETAFTYNNQFSNALEVPYVVINVDDYFDPARFNVQPFGVVGVFCAGKIVFGVYGDTNAGGLMGEASLNLAQKCFGPSMNGNNGYDEDNALYFAFTGEESVDPSAGTNIAELDAKGASLLASL